MYINNEFIRYNLQVLFFSFIKFHLIKPMDMEADKITFCLFFDNAKIRGLYFM